MAKLSELKYLMQELDRPDSKFISEWKRLSDQDKKELKEYAAEEMAVLEVEEG